MDTMNDTQPNILFTLFMKEKATEASVRRALTEASKARDVAFSDMKKSQAAHVLAVSKHETLQTELRQRTIAVMLIHDAWKKVHWRIPLTSKRVTIILKRLPMK
jgi:hypothetical protein